MCRTSVQWKTVNRTRNALKKKVLEEDYKELWEEIHGSFKATEEDAIKCIEHYNSLLDKPEICSKIQKGLEKFFLYMYDEWGDFSDIYGNIEDSLKPVMDGYNEGKQLITYLYDPTLYVFPQLENEIGYGVVFECPWEPEHQCSIMIRNDKVVYVGPDESEDPWGDEDDYYCIWNDTDED